MASAAHFFGGISCPSDVGLGVVDRTIQDWSVRAVQHQGLCKVLGTNHKMNGLIQVGSLGAQYQEMGFQHEFHSEDGD